MKKYKLLRFGKCYLHKEGDFVVALLRGSKESGYYFVGSHAHPSVFLMDFHLLSRIVDNDGTWVEIEPEVFNIASALHISGYGMKHSTVNGEVLHVISKSY